VNPGGTLGAAPSGRSDKGLRLSLGETLRQAWADEDLRRRIIFVLCVFGIYALGIHVAVPIPGISADGIAKALEGNRFFQMINTIGGGGFKRISIFALGLGPYITSSIIMQVLQQSLPSWKAEMQEGGEYARKQQNRRTRMLALVLALGQGFTLLSSMGPGVISGPNPMLTKIGVSIFWMAGSMILLWLGEQISEKGIGNGTSLIIFAGIVISFPGIIEIVGRSVRDGAINYFQVATLAVLFLATTWFIVFFTTAQRRIPIQHMRRNFGTKTVGGQTSYLPISVNMAGVIPVIFALTLITMPYQFASAFPQGSDAQNAILAVGKFFSPDFTHWQGYLGALVYMALIFGFTYLWNAMVYNVEDIANNLKRGGSYIPGIRPGKQTIDFLNGIISRVTFVGALFLSIVALTQFVFPLIAPVSQLSTMSGTSLLIMVSVALETMRQIESNLLVKQFGG
jgi:preprotein translocase subunit SecY